MDYCNSLTNCFHYIHILFQSDPLSADLLFSNYLLWLLLDLRYSIDNGRKSN